MDVCIIDKNIQIVLDYIKKGEFQIVNVNPNKYIYTIECNGVSCDKCHLPGKHCGAICEDALEYIKDNKLFPQEFI